MVEYFYTGIYLQPVHKTFAAGCSMLNVNLFIIADKYETPDLAIIASGNFIDSLQSEYLSSNFGAVIRELYENSPDNTLGKEMRRKVVQTCTALEVTCTTQVGRSEAIRTAIKDVTLFGIEYQRSALQSATEMLRKKIEGMNAKYRTVKCLLCRRDFGVPREVPERTVVYCTVCSAITLMPAATAN